MELARLSGSGLRGDPLLSVDWEDHWRHLVRRRAARFGRHEWNQFDRIARNYAAAVARQADPLLEFIEPFLSPGTTLIDVGAGSGRHVVPLAPRLKHVFAVEPSSGMRELIPVIANVTVIGADWLSAGVPPADLVLSSHVLYAIEEPVPFIRKMEALARERVFIYLRDSQPVHPSVPLAEALTGEPTPRMPQLTDLYLLLRQIGVAPAVVSWPNRWVQRFPDLDSAATACRDRLGDRWDERRGRGWLVDHLESAPDGSLTFTDPHSVVGVVHWQLSPGNQRGRV
jgi:SAM-dependent methyltransferase